MTTTSRDIRALAAWTITALVLTLALLAGAPSQARAAVTYVAASPATGVEPVPASRCGYDVAYDMAVPYGTAQRCWASSIYYPNLQGWYAKVGRPGDCNYTPFARYFGPGYYSGISCIAASRASAWKLVNGAWVQTIVLSGTTGYVYPYTADWRWVYVNDGWVAMRAGDVGIYW